MLKKDELKILKLLFDDLTRQLSISDLSRLLKQKYVQTYRTVYNLKKTKLIKIKDVGNSKIIELDFMQIIPEYDVVEIERTKLRCENKIISIIRNNLISMRKEFICVLFGSYALGKQKKASDIDLLFVIPEEYNFAEFEKLVKKQLVPYNCDINITTEQGILEMWVHPEKLNVGNEILKKHAVLYGAEHFLNLLRYKYVG